MPQTIARPTPSPSPNTHSRTVPHTTHLCHVRQHKRTPKPHKTSPQKRQHEPWSHRTTPGQVQGLGPDGPRGAGRCLRGHSKHGLCPRRQAGGERVWEEEVRQTTRPTQAAPRRLNRFNLTPLQHQAVREMRRENLKHACMEISSASDAHRARTHTLSCLCKADVN